MNGMRTGLRHRIRRSLRQVEEQHAQLRRIASELDRAQGDGRADEVLVWMRHLHDALSAHFDLEEEILFPALHGLEASTTADLRRLESEHGEFLEMLAGLLDEPGMAPDERARRIGSLRIGLANHERREEKVIGIALESTAGR